MWRKFIALGLFGMVGAASAQQTVDEALQNMMVFDCEAEGQSALYVFRTGLNDETVLLDDPSVPVRRAGDKFSVITSEGAREISAEAYFLYKDGAAISGTCTDTTATAQAIFPTMIDGLLMGSSEGMAEAAAASILVEDMRIKTEAEIARITSEADLAQAALASELEAAKAELLTAQTELATANEQLPALFDSADGLSKSLEEKEAELAALSQNFDKNLLELASERAAHEELSGQISTMETDLAEAGAKIAELEAALAKEQEVSALKDTALERAMVRVDEAQAELEKVTRERRSLAANVASLNQRTSDLAGQLKRAERDLEKAKDTKPEPVKVVSGSGSLADVAISRIATLQNRGISDVQRELCGLISSGSRPARCR